MSDRPDGSRGARRWSRLPAALLARRLRRCAADPTADRLDAAFDLVGPGRGPDLFPVGRGEALLVGSSSAAGARGRR